MFFSSFSNFKKEKNVVGRWLLEALCYIHTGYVWQGSRTPWKWVSVCTLSIWCSHWSVTTRFSACSHKCQRGANFTNLTPCFFSPSSIWIYKGMAQWPHILFIYLTYRYVLLHWLFIESGWANKCSLWPVARSIPNKKNVNEHFHSTGSLNCVHP